MSSHPLHNILHPISYSGDRHTRHYSMSGTHTQRYNYSGVLQRSWKDASSQCVVCTSNEFGPYTCSQEREWVYVSWGKGMLLGVATGLVYRKTWIYGWQSIKKTVRESLMIWQFCGVPKYHRASGHERSGAQGHFPLSIMPVSKVHLS